MTATTVELRGWVLVRTRAGANSELRVYQRSEDRLGSFLSPIQLKIVSLLGADGADYVRTSTGNDWLLAQQLRAAVREHPVLWGLEPPRTGARWTQQIVELRTGIVYMLEREDDGAEWAQRVAGPRPAHLRS